MKFKKLLSALAVSSAFVAGSAIAAPVVINVNAFDATPAVGTDGLTAPITALGLNWSATSTYTDTNNSGVLDFGDLVTDSGSGSAIYLGAGNAVISGGENNEGNTFTHSLLFSYANLMGSVVVNDGAGGIGAIYSSGTINVFGDGLDGSAQTLLMTLGVTGSTGTIGNFSLFTEVLTAAPGVFFYNGVTDFSDMLLELKVIVGEANFNTTPLVPSEIDGSSPLQWERTTTLNGNLVFDVPEPGMIALLGLGLFGLGVARRNKKVA